MQGETALENQPDTSDENPPGVADGVVQGPVGIRRLCHDLNNPLAVVMGQLEMISERHKDLPADLKRRMEEMKKASFAMREMIRDAGLEARRAMGVEE